MYAPHTRDHIINVLCGGDVEWGEAKIKEAIAKKRVQKDSTFPNDPAKTSYWVLETQKMKFSTEFEAATALEGEAEVTGDQASQMIADGGGFDTHPGLVLLPTHHPTPPYRNQQPQSYTKNALPKTSPATPLLTLPLGCQPYICVLYNIWATRRFQRRRAGGGRRSGRRAIGAGGGRRGAGRKPAMTCTLPRYAHITIRPLNF